MDTHKRVLLVWHRRAGKDKLCFNKLICKALERPCNLAYYFPTAKLGRKALWKNVDVTNGMAVIDHIPKPILAKPPNQTEMMIELVNGSTIQVLGTDNLDVVGGNYFGMVFSEYSLQDPQAWEYSRPILVENGGFAWFNGTPRGENHMFEMLRTNQGNDRWFTQVLTVEDTGVVSAEDIAEERRSGMKEAKIRQEFYCDFSAPNEEAIYGPLMSKAQAEGRIANFPVDGRAPVDLYWDLGSPRNTVVWYGQRLPYGVTRFVDIDAGLEFASLVERVTYIRRKGYSLGRCYLPHDARQTARNGSTFERDLREAGMTDIVVVPPIQNVWDGVRKVSELLPTFEFRVPACEEGVKALKAYERRPPSKSGVDPDEPLHNWASHYADALRTCAEAEAAGLLSKSRAAMAGGGNRVVVLTGTR